MTRCPFFAFVATVVSVLTIGSAVRVGYSAAMRRGDRQRDYAVQLARGQAIIPLAI